MSVRSIALAAYVAEEERKKKQADERQAREDAIERERWLAQRDRAFNALAVSKLREWFPGVEWEWYGEQITPNRPPIFVQADRPGGTNPEYVGIPCFEVSPTGVKGVTEHPGEGYPYWDGPWLSTLADVGAWITNTVIPKSFKLNPTQKDVVD